MNTQIIKITDTSERDLAMSARLKELVRERRRLVAAGRESEALTNEQIIEQVNREMEETAANHEIGNPMQSDFER